MKNIKSNNTRWLLILYDTVSFILVSIALFLLYDGTVRLFTNDYIAHFCTAFVCVFVSRLAFRIYSQIWRYGGIQGYIRLILADACAIVPYLVINYSHLIETIAFSHIASLISVNCLIALSMRMAYRYAYKTGRFSALLSIFSLGKVKPHIYQDDSKIKVAIVGAGSVGVALAEELIANPNSSYIPRCFIEIDKMKIGRSIHDIPVFSENSATLDQLEKHGVQELIFAVPQLDVDSKKRLYDYYRQAGFKIKIYDYPVVYSSNGKRTLREFEPEDLLFRKPITVTDDKTIAYYKDKAVLITGGGGSIGSELCRQIAKMNPRLLVIVDICENGAYDIQQELKMIYGASLNIVIKIVSVCNRSGLERVFKKYKPQIVINAAAHKHVPLMEEDCVEAVENNVFGTLNTVELSEKYGVERFIMVSTDKAVNPTNVMGATKRMCELIVLNHAGKMTCSATRFGNVLGSAGSVIPLFKKQIAAGGPITITDKRIVRFFMTIPEAAQLVLQSGAMAKDKELFVLDMGQPVKILDLAENMIHLSGQSKIEIVETGLRPGEKLYEELLVKTEDLDKTDNELIFIERDKPIGQDEVQKKLELLRNAVSSGDDQGVKNTLKEAVPTYKNPETYNQLKREQSNVCA